MKLLKNQQEFEEWKELNVCACDTCEEPKEFPCYVNHKLINDCSSEQVSFYLYRYDIEKMLRSLKDTNCCDGGPQWGHSWDCPKCPE